MTDGKNLKLNIHLHILRRKVRESGLLPAEIEARLGWERGVLVYMLHQSRTLRYDHLFGLLEALRVHPSVYFRQVAQLLTKPIDDEQMIQRERAWIRAWVLAGRSII